MPLGTLPPFDLDALLTIVSAGVQPPTDAVAKEPKRPVVIRDDDDSDDEEAKSPRTTPYDMNNPEHYDLAIAQERHELEQGQGKRERELDY